MGFVTSNCHYLRLLSKVAEGNDKRRILKFSQFNKFVCTTPMAFHLYLVTKRSYLLDVVAWTKWSIYIVDDICQCTSFLFCMLYWAVLIVSNQSLSVRRKAITRIDVKLIHWCISVCFDDMLSVTWHWLNVSWLKFSFIPLKPNFIIVFFSLPMSHLMIRHIFVLRLFIVMKSEISITSHCLRLAHETMICAVCHVIYLLIHIRGRPWKAQGSVLGELTGIISISDSGVGSKDHMINRFVRLDRFYGRTPHHFIRTLRLERNDWYIADDIFDCCFV